MLVASGIELDRGVRADRDGIYRIGGIRAEPSDPAEGEHRRRLRERYFDAAGPRGHKAVCHTQMGAAPWGLSLSAPLTCRRCS